MEWKFKPYTEDDTRENPTQSQFFTTGIVEGVANGLIREGIQNALDEQYDETKPVQIVITLSDKFTSLEPNLYKKYLHGLLPHLAESQSVVRDAPNFDEEFMDYLVFEDFNTKGLRGNPIESKDAEIEKEGIPHNFYYFWRNVGITGKPEDKLGRWGIGKTVFPASSRINTYWGYTIQSDTGDALLLGQSILKKHNIKDHPKDWGYRPYGYFGSFEGGSCFAQPLRDQQVLSSFRSNFNLQRNLEPGLSIVVPFVKREINVQNLLRAVVSQYFYPIMKGKLEVTLRSTGEQIVINKSTLDDIVNRINVETSDVDEKKFNGDQLHSLFEFVNWTITLPSEDYIALSSPKAANQPRWDEKLWQGINIEEIIQRFELKRRIAFKVPVKYHLVHGAQPKICWFNAYLEKDDGVIRPENHFIREHITILEIKSLESAGVRGMVVVEDKELANMLGDSENPAHTQWQKDSQNFAGKYVDGDKCIQFITRSLQRLFLKLQRPAVGLDRDILTDLFYLHDETSDDKPTTPDDDTTKDDQIEPVAIDIEPPASRVRVMTKRIQGGILVYCNVGAKEFVEEVGLQLAYNTRRGNPLRKYTEYDFDVSRAPIFINPVGCQVITRVNNEIKIQPVEDSFELEVIGFDENRDLFVDVKTLLKDHDQEI